MTAAKTPLVRSAPALTRRLVRPMPAVKMRRLHGRAVAAARPHSSCTATLQQPPARNEGRPAKPPEASRLRRQQQRPA